MRERAKEKYIKERRESRERRHETQENTKEKHETG